METMTLEPATRAKEIKTAINGRWFRQWGIWGIFYI